MGRTMRDEQCCRFSWRSPWKILMSMLLGTAYSELSKFNCPYGETNPEGDIHLLHGNNLIITCQVDYSKLLRDFRDDKFEQQIVPTNNSMSDGIVFYKSGQLVSKEHVTIVNATAARLNISNPNAGVDFYYCRLKLDDRSHGNTSGARLSSNDSTRQLINVCYNYVVIGYAPLEIKNFTCLSTDWEELKCDWIKPENPIDTQYNISFTFPDSPPSEKNPYECPTKSDINENTCVWNHNTVPVYQFLQDYYNFTLTGINIFGTSKKAFYFDHFANVKPNAPDTWVLDKTPTVIVLKWNISRLHYTMKFHHKIEYKSQWGAEDTILLFNKTKCTTETNSTGECFNFFYNLTDLYPFTNYSISVYLRSSQATDEDKWSKPSQIWEITEPTIPVRPPRTDIGSFQSFSVNISTRNVLIYWQHIEEYEKLGPSFQYYVNYTATTEDYNVTKTPISVKQCYAEFEGLRASIDYTFYVYSANNIGFSTKYSVVYVPRNYDKLGGPKSLTSIKFDKFKTIELSWKNSQESSTANETRNYTLFWCDDVEYHLYRRCNGFLNWTQISISQPYYNRTELINNSEKMYTFAISHNSWSSRTDSLSSSGMVWTSCTVILNKTIVEPTKHVWVSRIDSREMELRWKFDCSDRIRTILELYGKIFYCPVNSTAKNSTCIESEMNKTITNLVEHDNNGVTIKNLKPNTIYKMRVDLFQNDKFKGTLNEPLFNITLDYDNVKSSHEGALGLGYRLGLGVTLSMVFVTIGAYWGKKSHVLSCICKYTAYKKRYTNGQTMPSEFVVEPGIASAFFNC